MTKGVWSEMGKSTLLPKLDLGSLLRFLDLEPQSKAVRALRDALRSNNKKRRSPAG